LSPSGSRLPADENRTFNGGTPFVTFALACASGWCDPRLKTTLFS
jgi:hypothetical protein